MLEMQFRSVDLTNQHVLCISKEKKRKLQITAISAINPGIEIFIFPLFQVASKQNNKLICATCDQFSDHL